VEARDKSAKNQALREDVLVRLFCVAMALLACVSLAHATEPTEIRIGYLRAFEPKQTLSFMQLPAENNGVAGAQLAVDDNNTTGKFINQRFVMEEVRVKPGDDVAVAAAALAKTNISLVIADLPADALLKAASAVRGHNVLFFNAGAIDDRLREEDCRANIVHTAPTRSMLADGLAQYLAWKRWRRWLLIVGSHPEDKLFADALRRAANRFGAKIVQERVFEDRGGTRRTDSGVVQVQRQMPVLTQQAPDYDVLVAADESEVFAGYLPYRTWDARPVAGSAGLVPVSWDPSHEMWGSHQMQNRFMAKFSRRMTALDMQAWSAARMIGEGASRKRATEPQTLLTFLKSSEFALAAFKGQRLTLRDWNQQLRQPILLADGRTVVSVSPQEGFLHQVSELDTLGVDRPESKCKLN
jgi:ABC transporter substrate binding protein (PQQ-dependent alcohol dehydrogenase system)